METTLNKTLPFHLLKAFVAHVIFHHHSAKPRGEGTSQTPPLTRTLIPLESAGVCKRWKPESCASERPHKQPTRPSRKSKRATLPCWLLTSQPQGMFLFQPGEQISPSLQSPAPTKIMSKVQWHYLALQDFFWEKTDLLLLPAVSWQAVVTNLSLPMKSTSFIPVDCDNMSSTHKIHGAAAFLETLLSPHKLSPHSPSVWKPSTRHALGCFVFFSQPETATGNQRGTRPACEPESQLLNSSPQSSQELFAHSHTFFPSFYFPQSED